VTLSQAKELDVGKKFNAEFLGERIPTLAEVIRLSRGRIQLNIELKYNWPDPSLAEKVVELLRREAFLTNCIITSLDTAALAEVQRLAPELKVGQIVTASVGNVTRLPGQILSVNQRAATRPFIQQARTAGKEVHVWTLNQAGDMLLMIERGANNLITDHPDVAVRVLRERRNYPTPRSWRSRFGRCSARTKQHLVAPIKALEPMSKASRATPSPNDVGNVIETHEHTGEFKELWTKPRKWVLTSKVHGDGGQLSFDHS
jgi:hypothetical protein